MTVSKLFALATIATVVVAIGFGLYMVGSPGEQRLLRYDEKRVRDLRNISSVMQLRWRNDLPLPAELDELVDGQYMRRPPLDPETRESYEYERLSEQVYRLCAVFYRASVRPAPADFWAHGAGRHCYEFTRETATELIFNPMAAPRSL